MNADLEKALKNVQTHFNKASVRNNVVEFTLPELSTKNILDLAEIKSRNSELNPWVFRSDKYVKVIFFIKNEQGGYFLLGQNGESNSILTVGDRVRLKFGGDGRVIELKKNTEINGFPFEKGQFVVEKDNNCTGETYSCISNVEFIIEKQSSTWDEDVEKTMNQHEFLSEFISYCEKEHGILIPDEAYENFLDA